LFVTFTLSFVVKAQVAEEIIVLDLSVTFTLGFDEDQVAEEIIVKGISITFTFDIIIEIKIVKVEPSVTASLIT